MSSDSSGEPPNSELAAGDELSDVYKPLSRPELRNRMANNFPATYLTMISIIQGVAIGVFAQNTFGAGMTASEFLLRSPYFLVSFLLIALVFWEYVWFTGIYRWSVKLSDTFAPLILGVLEIGSFYFFRNISVWWLMNFFICLAGTFAFSNTYRHVTRKIFDAGEHGSTVYATTMRDIRRSMYITSTSSVVCLSGAVLSFWARSWFTQLQLTSSPDSLLGAAYVLYLCLILLLFFKDRSFVQSIHSEYKLRY